jgi:hypothetical protein
MARLSPNNMDLPGWRGSFFNLIDRDSADLAKIFLPLSGTIGLDFCEFKGLFADSRQDEPFARASRGFGQQLSQPACSYFKDQESKDHQGFL